MPYDPRMMAQMAQMGVGMMGPPQGDPFARNAPKQKEWWEQPLPRRMGEAPQDDPANPDDPNAPRKKPPSLYDMMMNLGRMSRPEYDRAIAGPGSYGVSPRDAARVSPWAFLGSMGGGPPR